MALHGDTGVLLASLVARVRHDGATLPLDPRAVLVARDGTRRWIRGSAQLVRDQDGFVTSVALVFRHVEAERE